MNITPELLRLFIRDESICWLCNGVVTKVQASRDHVIPKSLGGPNHMENYKLAHKECNSNRGNDEVLPSKDEVLSILIRVQNGLCAKCGCNNKALISVISKHVSQKRRELKILCRKCGMNEKKVSAFGLKPKRIKLKKISVNEKRVPMDMSVIDSMLAFYIQEDDYARFHDINGVLRSGPVLSVEDMGDTINVTMADDEQDGEPITYYVKAEQTIELLGYAEMAI